VYGKSFFRNILEVFPDSTNIFTVYHESRMIAAEIGSWFKNMLESHRPRPSAIIRCSVLTTCSIGGAIRFAIGKGLNRLDFGRSTPHEGTYHSKKQWGAQPVQLYWQYLMDSHKMMPISARQIQNIKLQFGSGRGFPYQRPGYLVR
jgi:serine/alanine adding enzyme